MDFLIIILASYIVKNAYLLSSVDRIIILELSGWFGNYTDNDRKHIPGVVYDAMINTRILII